MLTKKHLVGIAVSMVIFGMFSLFLIGMNAAAFAGVDINGPYEALATGPTRVPVADTVLVLPAVPVTIEVAGVTLSLAGFTIAEVSSGAGMLVGFVVGLYYAISIAREQRKDAQTDESAPSGE